MPIAVDRLVAGKWPAEFRLTGANAMMQGTRFEGPVEITARVDYDGEARTRLPGDVEGRVRTAIPDGAITLVLSDRVR